MFEMKLELPPLDNVFLGCPGVQCSESEDRGGERQTFQQADNSSTAHRPEFHPPPKRA